MKKEEKINSEKDDGDSKSKLDKHAKTESQKSSDESSQNLAQLDSRRSPTENQNKTESSEKLEIFKKTKEIENHLRFHGALSKSRDDRTAWNAKCRIVLDEIIERIRISPNKKFITFEILLKTYNPKENGGWNEKLQSCKKDFEEIFYGSDEKPPLISEKNTDFEGYIEDKFKELGNKDEVAIFLENMHHLPALLEISKYYFKLVESDKNQVEKTESLLRILHLFGQNYINLVNKKSLRTTGDDSAIMDLFSQEFISSPKPKSSALLLAEMIRWTVSFKEFSAPASEKDKKEIKELEQRISELENKLTESETERDISIEEIEGVKAVKEELSERLESKESEVFRLMENLERERNFLKVASLKSMNAKLDNIHKSIKHKSEFLRAFLERDNPNVKSALKQLDDIDETLRELTNRV